MNRRDFFKLLGAGVAALVVPRGLNGLTHSITLGGPETAGVHYPRAGSLSLHVEDQWFEVLRFVEFDGSVYYMTEAGVYKWEKPGEKTLRLYKNYRDTIEQMCYNK
jgi:hypothetical protein